MIRAFKLCAQAVYRVFQVRPGQSAPSAPDDLRRVELRGLLIDSENSVDAVRPRRRVLQLRASRGSVAEAEVGAFPDFPDFLDIVVAVQFLGSLRCMGFCTVVGRQCRCVVLEALGAVEGLVA